MNELASALGGFCREGHVSTAGAHAGGNSFHEYAIAVQIENLAYDFLLGFIRAADVTHAHSGISFELDA